jgi:3-oxocholest-4-en-26-oyl-CoA dehydrogenase alpha subunit
MDLDYSVGDLELRREIRDYLDDLIPPAERHHAQGETYGPNDREIIRRMGADGWLGLSFPKEYGGQGRPQAEHYLFFDEAQKAGAPVSHVTLMTVAPALLRFGTEEQRRTFLPKIFAGEILFSIGYTEPEAGTDLARLKTTAERVDDRYVVNGQKYFTSGGDSADYIWLAARTGEPDSGRTGISVLIVDTDQPGFRADPIKTLSAHWTTVTYYEGVEVPVDWRVGEENDGWQVITSQLNFERLTIVMPGPIQKVFGEVCAWAGREVLPSGERLIDEPWVQMNLARVHANIEALKLLNWRIVWAPAEQPLSRASSSVVKVFGSELQIEAYRLLLEVVGPRGYLRDSATAAVLGAKLETGYRGATIKTFGGGVNEIMRELIAQSGLGSPVSPRRIR